MVCSERVGGWIGLIRPIGKRPGSAWCGLASSIDRKQPVLVRDSGIHLFAIHKPLRHRGFQELSLTDRGDLAYLWGGLFLRSGWDGLTPRVQAVPCNPYVSGVACSGRYRACFSPA